MKTTTEPEAYCAEMNCDWQGEVPAIAKCPKCNGRNLRRSVPPAPDQIASALRSLLARLDSITTEEFARGGDRAEREAARAILARIGAA